MKGKESLYCQERISGKIAYCKRQKSLKSASEAALAMPQAGFGGQYFHEFPHEMGAAHLFHLVRNHAFMDKGAVTAFFQKHLKIPDKISKSNYEEGTRIMALTAKLWMSGTQA